MPITIAIVYEDYWQALAAGRLDLCGAPCPDATCRAETGGMPLVLSRSRIARGLVLLERDGDGELMTTDVAIVVALARCTQCGHRCRILPADVLPQKTYAAPVIEYAICRRVHGNRSLREVAWTMLGMRTPGHTTLHGWVQGLGAHVLGRPAGEMIGVSAARVVAEIDSHAPGAADHMQAEVDVDPRRYRSEAQHDRFAAVVRILLVTAWVAAAATASSCTLPCATITTCRSLMARWSHSCALAFPSRLLCTAIEHLDRSAPPASRSSPGARCPTHTRSLPSASSASHR